MAVAAVVLSGVRQGTRARCRERSRKGVRARECERERQGGAWRRQARGGSRRRQAGAGAARVCALHAAASPSGRRLKKGAALAGLHSVGPAEEPDGL